MWQECVHFLHPLVDNIPFGWIQNEGFAQEIQRFVCKRSPKMCWFLLHIVCSHVCSNVCRHDTAAEARVKLFIPCNTTPMQVCLWEYYHVFGHPVDGTMNPHDPLKGVSVNGYVHSQLINLPQYIWWKPPLSHGVHGHVLHKYTCMYMIIVTLYYCGIECFLPCTAFMLRD